jgi:hypothetical protein
VPGQLGHEVPAGGRRFEPGEKARHRIRAHGEFERVTGDAAFDDDSSSKKRHRLGSLWNAATTHDEIAPRDRPPGTGGETEDTEPLEPVAAVARDAIDPALAVPFRGEPKAAVEGAALAAQHAAPNGESDEGEEGERENATEHLGDIRQADPLLRTLPSPSLRATPFLVQLTCGPQPRLGTLLRPDIGLISSRPLAIEILRSPGHVDLVG